MTISTPVPIARGRDGNLAQQHRRSRNLGPVASGGNGNPSNSTARAFSHSTAISTPALKTTSTAWKSGVRPTARVDDRRYRGVRGRHQSVGRGYDGVRWRTVFGHEQRYHRRTALAFGDGTTWTPVGAPGMGDSHNINPMASSSSGGSFMCSRATASPASRRGVRRTEHTGRRSTRTGSEIAAMSSRFGQVD